METNNVFIRHFAVNSKKFSIATVAGVYKQINGILNFGISACSKTDQYNRKLGNRIATGRAEKNPFKVVNVGFAENRKDLLEYLYTISSSNIEHYINKQSIVHRGFTGVSKRDGWD